MNPDALLKRIGIDFAEPALLLTALTHASAGKDNYERLEFLGDRVLNLVMAGLLYHEFPLEKEGSLAKRHATLVSGITIAAIAEEIDLGSAMILSGAERASGGARNENMLADTLEALLGAVYLDSGLETCQDLVVRLWGDRLGSLQSPPQDPKTALQEWAQGNGHALPVYDVVTREGPDHAPEFTVEVTVAGLPPAKARAGSRRAAEKRAAAAFLERNKSP